VSKVDREGRSELHYVAADGRSGRAEELIAAGIDVAAGDKRGMTPLHFAAQENNPEIAKKLLEAGAPVDPQDEHGNTPLWKAVFSCKGDGELIALLRAAGADPSRANRHGTSPLQLARRIGNYDVAQHFEDLADE
jgi:uncharacterized protein